MYNIIGMARGKSCIYARSIVTVPEYVCSLQAVECHLRVMKTVMTKRSFLTANKDINGNADANKRAGNN
jgi:hypothetical protein